MMPAREDELIDETTDDARLKALAIRRNGVAMDLKTQLQLSSGRGSIKWP